MILFCYFALRPTPRPTPDGCATCDRDSNERGVIWNALYRESPEATASSCNQGWPMVQEPIFPLRRRTSRVKTAEGVWVLWTCDGRDEISQVRDLSLGGLFVETASPSAVGATTALDFLFLGGRIKADAVVLHLNP